MGTEGDLLIHRILWAWDWRPGVLLVLLTLGFVYARGWRRIRDHAGGASLATRWRLVAYQGGLAAVALALVSPLDRLAELSFTAHMIQHQLLLMGAPPLCLLGEPFPMVLWGLPRRARRAVGRSLAPGRFARRAWRFLTWMPVAGLLYTVNLWGWHYPPAYELTLRNGLVHDLEHLAFFGTSVLFWWPIVNPAPRLTRLTGGIQYGARIGYLLLATAQNTLLGAVLGLAERVLYPTYAAAPRVFYDWTALDDQAFGGGIMWSGSHMFLIAILVLLHRALGPEGEKRDARPPAIV